MGENKNATRDADQRGIDNKVDLHHREISKNIR